MGGMGTTTGTMIGLDVGQRRVGVAVGDGGTKIATPLAALANDGELFGKLRDIILEKQATTLVVGLPRNNSGEETAQSTVSRQFLTDFGQFLDKEADELSLQFQDESLSSVTAEDRLRARKNFSENMLRDGTLDSEAAAVILTDFMEAN